MALYSYQLILQVPGLRRTHVQWYVPAVVAGLSQRPRGTFARPRDVVRFELSCHRRYLFGLPIGRPPKPAPQAQRPANYTDRKDGGAPRTCAFLNSEIGRGTPSACDNDEAQNYLRSL